MIRIESLDAGDDMSEVRILFEEYAAGLGVDLCFQGFARELAELPGGYAPPDGRLLLARADDQPVGCIALRRLEESTCEMKRLYVRTSQRGTGLGHALAARILADARTIGYRAMRLDTLATMTAARGLYQSLGFRPIEPYCFNPLESVAYLELRL